MTPLTPHQDSMWLQQLEKAAHWRSCLMYPPWFCHISYCNIFPFGFFYQTLKKIHFKLKNSPTHTVYGFYSVYLAEVYQKEKTLDYPGHALYIILKWTNFSSYSFPYIYKAPPSHPIYKILNLTLVTQGFFSPYPIQVCSDLLASLLYHHPLSHLLT